MFLSVEYVLPTTHTKRRVSCPSITKVTFQNNSKTEVGHILNREKMENSNSTPAITENSAYQSLLNSMLADSRRLRLRRLPVWVRTGSGTPQDGQMLVFRPVQTLQDQIPAPLERVKTPPEEKPELIPIQDYALLKKYLEPKETKSQEKSEEKEQRAEFMASLMFSTFLDSSEFKD